MDSVLGRRLNDGYGVGLSFWDEIDEVDEVDISGWMASILSTLSILSKKGFETFLRPTAFLG